MREHPQMRIRLSPELKKQVKESAEANNRSMNSEIIYQLKKAYAS